MMSSFEFSIRSKTGKQTMLCMSSHLKIGCDVIERYASSDLRSCSVNTLFLFWRASMLPCASATLAFSSLLNLSFSSVIIGSFVFLSFGTFRLRSVLHLLSAASFLLPRD
uniref:Uncharacterized protein n=1 Tax=Cucumis melo TaxID=3656 RepID=A0A9I9EM48_CUCME